MRKLSASLMLLCCMVSSAVAQVCVKGIVFDDTLRKPVDAAGIYFPDLDLATVTDGEGKFSLCHLPFGNVRMQVKRLGYKTVVQTLLLKDSVAEVRISLSLTSIEYPEVVIYGTQSSKPEETPNNITALSAAQMRESGAFSISDAMAKLPGVSQLTTGTGISKPVIRGLFGNRVQTVFLGMRFDNQQWQDEHGLGLSDVGIDRVEVIKGPSSLLYGSEAMGGVLNIIEEKPAPVGKTVGDVSTRFFSNTFGTATDAGVKGAGEKFSWRIRAGVESHADYTDGNNYRVLNSRFGGYYGKASLGYRNRRWTTNNNYMFSLSNFGFIMDPIQLTYTPDGRQSRSFDKPHHSVYVNILSSQNTFYLRASKIKLNLGTHINNRQEQEGGSRISLDMLLNTYSGNLLWIKDIGEHSEFSIGTEDMYQSNRNLGSRTIVPDANLLESSAFVYLKHSRKYFFTEGGLRYDWKNIQTFATESINTLGNNPGVNVVPFNKMYSALNGSLGISLFDTRHWNVKVNASSGYRAGNLAELSSNGLHEGSLRYEIGNTDLKIEQNLCSDVFASYDSKNITLSASAYVNRFLNYIYLAPTSTEYIGFKIYNYVQKNATLQGAEATAEVHPASASWLVFKTAYSGIVGKTDDGEYLPFVPAQKINSELKFRLENKGRISSPFFKVGSDYVFAQTTPAQFETPTSEYLLLNAGFGLTLQGRKAQTQISLAGNNLTNAVYYDHLSRYKDFSIYNMGRNIVLGIKITFA